MKPLSPAALCALIAAVGGMIGGSTAVHGLKQNRYGPVDPPALSSAGFERGSEEYAASATADCDGCSERDLGYRWATMSDVRRPDQCPHDSWGFRRGCLDFTGEI